MDKEKVELKDNENYTISLTGKQWAQVHWAVGESQLPHKDCINIVESIGEQLRQLANTPEIAD